jgi:putative heme-binding domain-containing protein
VQALFQQALTTAQDSNQPAERRRVALGLVAQGNFAQTGDALLTLVDPRQPSEVQAAAVRALGLMRDERIAATLLDAQRFPAYTPRLREDVLSTMLSNPQHLPGLMTAIEAGTVPRGAVDSLRRRQLTEHRDPALRDRARRLFDTAAAGNRAKVYDELKGLVSLTADPVNGQAVFKKTCAPCHRLDREGVPVGPDLFGIRNQPKEAILLHIVIPEHEITPGFAAYVVSTTDGRVLTGLVAGETATSVTIRQALGKEETILRQDIEQLVASQLSLMPQEIEKNHTKQELADLIAYLKGEKPPP